jgi:hypothetical protein
VSRLRTVLTAGVRVSCNRLVTRAAPTGAVTVRDR